MFSKKGMSLIAVLGLLIFSVYAAAGPNANAVLSLDLIADGGAGNGTGDGVTSGTVSGQGTTIAIEIFATGVGTSLIGMTLEFDFDSSLLSFVEAENSAFPLVLPEGSTGTHLATRNPVTLASSGFLARAEFTTVSDVAAREFSIGIESVTLAESTTSSDELITTSVITFNASPSPDFDGDDWVGFSDFLIFAQVFGSERGDGTYDARIDLNSDGSIGFTDFLIFAQSFGSAPPSTGGGNPDLVVQSPSVSDNNVASGATFTLGATVRNQGDGSSAATTLHYYRSDDATIDATDTEVGTDAVRGLAAGRASADSISLNAPSDAGTYYYGACVDAVTGESDSGNNCSAAVSITVAAVIPSDGRAALVALYKATDGPNWTDKENWSSAAPLGEWYGVTTDDNGRVTHLNLTDNSLQGTIPVELGQLTNLTELDLSENQLTGAIPVELGQLTNLTWLDLRDNQLTGAIPVELGQLAKLRGLHLDVNTLTGPIPTGLGQLTNLTYLYLSWNQLTGAIPVELGQLTNLTSLWLSSNQLTGAIPVELGQLTKLTSLSLFNNQLTGAIPVELGQLTKLTSLILFNNQLTGAIPVELGQLTKLTSLILFNNQLTGAIPVELEQLTNLTHLYLSDNQLTGAIPVELGQLTNLTTLNLSNNALTDAIPQSLTGLTKLDQFSFYHTGLCAPLNAAFQTWLQGIDEALGENCSGTPPPSGSPDLIVEYLLVPVLNTLTTGLSYDFGATVRNQGNASSASTTLRIYRSTDATVSSNDTEVGTDGVSSLSAGDTSDESFSLNAPSDAGTYYFVACVDPVSGENNTGNNCSSSVSVAVIASGSPDLIVESPSVNDNTLTTGQSFTLGATVRNQGNASSASTTLRYYRSSNATISSRDTEVGTDGVSSLSAGDTSAESISLTAPSSAGTYYYGACVESVSGESDTDNNCSSGVTVTVSGTPPPSGSPDLIVESPSVNDNTPTTGQSFTLRATVRNQGNASSASTTLRYYRSSNATISSRDTEVGTDGVSSLSAGDTSAESISLTAPSSAGTYYYGACVESVSGESDTGNNCSSGVTVTVSGTPPPSGSPDLIVESPSVNDNTLTTGQSFTLRATVRNQGNASSASTTLRYYRSSNATISSSDTEVGTDGVSSLSAGDTSAESISLTAPSSAGTYYYGACVDNVSGESDTGNNCSSGATVTVSGEGGGTSQTCAVGLELNSGDGCSGSGYTLRNDASVLVVNGNIGGIRLSNSRFSGGSVNLNNMRITRSGNVWTIVSLP